MRRLICSIVVHICHKQVFSWRGSYTLTRDGTPLLSCSYKTKSTYFLKLTFRLLCRLLHFNHENIIITTEPASLLKIIAEEFRNSPHNTTYNKQKWWSAAILFQWHLSCQNTKACPFQHFISAKYFHEKYTNFNLGPAHIQQTEYMKYEWIMLIVLVFYSIVGTDHEIPHITPVFDIRPLSFLNF